MSRLRTTGGRLCLTADGRAKPCDCVSDCCQCAASCNYSGVTATVQSAGLFRAYYRIYDTFGNLEDEWVWLTEPRISAPVANTDCEILPITIRLDLGRATYRGNGSEQSLVRRFGSVPGGVPEVPPDQPGGLPEIPSFDVTDGYARLILTCTYSQGSGQFNVDSRIELAWNQSEFSQSVHVNGITNSVPGIDPVSPPCFAAEPGASFRVRGPGAGQPEYTIPVFVSAGGGDALLRYTVGNGDVEYEFPMRDGRVGRIQIQADALTIVRLTGAVACGAPVPSLNPACCAAVTNPGACVPSAGGVRFKIDISHSIGHEIYRGSFQGVPDGRVHGSSVQYRLSLSGRAAPMSCAVTRAIRSVAENIGLIRVSGSLTRADFTTAYEPGRPASSASTRVEVDAAENISTASASFIFNPDASMRFAAAYIPNGSGFHLLPWWSIPPLYGGHPSNGFDVSINPSSDYSASSIDPLMRGPGFHDHGAPPFIPHPSFQNFRNNDFIGYQLERFCPTLVRMFHFSTANRFVEGVDYDGPYFAFGQCSTSIRIELRCFATCGAAEPLVVGCGGCGRSVSDVGARVA